MSMRRHAAPERPMVVPLEGRLLNSVLALGAVAPPDRSSYPAAVAAMASSLARGRSSVGNATGSMVTPDRASDTEGRTPHRRPETEREPSGGGSPGESREKAAIAGIGDVMDGHFDAIIAGAVGLMGGHLEASDGLAGATATGAAGIRGGMDAPLSAAALHSARPGGPDPSGHDAGMAYLRRPTAQGFGTMTPETAHGAIGERPTADQGGADESLHESLGAGRSGLGVDLEPHLDAELEASVSGAGGGRGAEGDPLVVLPGDGLQWEPLDRRATAADGDALADATLAGTRGDMISAAITRPKKKMPRPDRADDGADSGPSSLAGAMLAIILLISRSPKDRGRLPQGILRRIVSR
jgi:hypothetical protein